MKRRAYLLTVLVFLLVVGCVWSDSLWERRNPYQSYLFQDTRARHVGDLLTIMVREATLFDGKEDRKMKKDHKNTTDLSLQMESQAGEKTNRSFEGNFDWQAQSSRELNGKADYKSDRTFTDRMTVRVVQVQSNGNLIVEGFRTRIVQGEERTLLVTGIVRPIDIGASNIVQSQYVGNLKMTYVGKGPETSYTTNGWLGKIVNVLWPF